MNHICRSRRGTAPVKLLYVPKDYRCRAPTFFCLLTFYFCLVWYQPSSLPTMIATRDNLTPDDYFAWEATQLEKHEYIDGKVYAMSGGSVNHGRIAKSLN